MHRLRSMGKDRLSLAALAKEKLQIVRIDTNGVK
jgi:hypothetical protein